MARLFDLFHSTQSPSGSKNFGPIAVVVTWFRWVGIAGAHTHWVSFYKLANNGDLVAIPGRELGSEIGRVSRVGQALDFIVEVRDNDVSSTRPTLNRYRFDGRGFLKLTPGKGTIEPPYGDVDGSDRGQNRTLLAMNLESDQR